MDFDKVITERYSVRKFEEKHLENKIIEKILNTPTGISLSYITTCTAISSFSS